MFCTAYFSAIFILFGYLFTSTVWKIAPFFFYFRYCSFVHFAVCPGMLEMLCTISLPRYVGHMCESRMLWTSIRFDSSPTFMFSCLRREHFLSAILFMRFGRNIWMLLHHRSIHKKALLQDTRAFFHIAERVFFIIIIYVVVK